MIKYYLKMVSSRTDPKMLFNIEKDPLELTNLTDDQAYKDDLDQSIRASQRKRIFVQDAMKHGRFPS